MKPSLRVVAQLVLVCWCGLATLRAAEPAPPRLAPIFNGKDLTGWKVPNPNPWWTVKDGVLIGVEDEKGVGHVLETEAVYNDVIVEMEARWSGDVDSGVFLRKGSKFQCQIGVSRSLKKDMTCSIYARGKYIAEAKNVEKLLKPGDWNLIRIEARGPKFRIWLNGELVLEYEDAGFPDAGPIGLQIHPKVKDMKVEFRNLSAVSLDEKGGGEKAEKKAP
jgi:hypothetical protein